MTVADQPQAAPRGRDPWFDNAKMALVLLVVVGHTWTLLPDTALNEHLYDALYAWHVPAFVLVTGYLSRSFRWERERLWRLVRTVAIPYVLFEALIAAFRIYVGGEKLADLFTDPHWPMWYLSALFFWRLLTPVFVAMGTALAVSTAVVASLVAGLYAGDVLDVARVLGLLPFFVLGLKATPERMERLRNGAARGWAVVVLAVIAVLATWTDTWARTEWLYYRSRYDELVTSDLEALVIRSVLLVVGTLGSLAFLALVPRLSGWFSRMGAWTLVVYLFHGFVVKSAAYAGFDDWADRHELLSLPLATAAAAAVALMLAWRPVATRLNVLVDPVGFAQREVETAHRLRDAGVRTDQLADGLAETVREADDRAPARSR